MFRSQKAEAVKAGKSSVKSADRREHSSCDTTRPRPADMDSSSVVINDETIVADQAAVTADRSLHTAPNSSVVGSTVRGITTDRASPGAVAGNANVRETTTKSTSRLFDLVNADSPVAQVSQYHYVYVNNKLTAS